MVDYVCCDCCGQMVVCGKEHKKGKWILCFKCKDKTNAEIKKEFSKSRWN